MSIWRHWHIVKDACWKLLILLTYHCNGDFVLQVWKTVIVFNFNPEMKRPLITLLKRINLQWTILLSDISQLLGSTSKLLHDFRGNRVIDKLICILLPNSSELSDRLPWIRVVIWAGNHHTRSREAFNWRWHLKWPRWGFSLNNWNKI